MAPRRAWVLNLDAELELANPTRYRPSPLVAARARSLRARVTGLLRDGDILLGEAPARPGDEPWLWCPTPSAVELARRAGLPLPPLPTLETLRRVNSRAFCAALGQPLPGAGYLDSLEALRRRVRQPSPTGDWYIKGPFGFAGRDRRQALNGALDPATEGFVTRTLARHGGVQVEPRVPRLADFAQHGWVRRDGRVSLAAPTRQHTDAQGRWRRSSDAADTLTPHEAARLRAEARRVGDALHAAGYFGPFGVDAYRYLWDDEVRFNARGEINARFTMGYRWPDAC